MTFVFLLTFPFSIFFRDWAIAIHTLFLFITLIYSKANKDNHFRGLQPSFCLLSLILRELMSVILQFLESLVLGAIRSYENTSTVEINTRISNRIVFFFTFWFFSSANPLLKISIYKELYTFVNCIISFTMKFMS